MLNRTLSALSPAISAFERRYRADEREHALLLDSMGRPIIERTGNEDSVQFTARELERACMGTLTHNHPKARPPSLDDLALSATYGLTLRAVGILPTGEHVDYTVNMLAPSASLAAAIDTQFNTEIAAAEKEFAGQFQGEALTHAARHLAVANLADRLGFKYQRMLTNAPVTEMKQSHEVQRINVLVRTETEMRREVLAPLHANIVHALTRNADARGIIPMDRLDIVRQIAGGYVVAAMLGKPQQDGTLTPYVHHQGRVVPVSPYFKMLWTLMHSAANVAINRHADMMRKHLPDDLIRQYEFANVLPNAAVVSEMDGDSAPGPQYEALHRWIGKDGKQLVDRIWNAAGDMRRKLDAYLTNAIASRKTAQQMSAELEPFLLSGAGSYEAMRLARSEVSTTGNRADWAAGKLNPLVEMYCPFTAPQHKCCDNCDEEEASGPYPKDDPSHIPGFHPECICGIRWIMAEDTDSIITRLRDNVKNAIANAKTALTDVIGPLSKRFIDFLFGGGR